ncbi:MAG: rhomboid family intramembrane serine protease [Myxococcota bacterium]
MTAPPQSASKRGSEFRRAVALSLLLVGALLAVDAARALAEPAGFAETSLGRASIGVLLALGAKVNAWVAAGQVERLVLAGFLHSGAGHLAMNALWLGAVSCAAAWISGVPAAFAATILGSVAGFCASALAGAGPSVGASAMVLGGAGLIAAHLVAHAASLPTPQRLAALIALGGALASTLVPGLGGGSGVAVDHAAHVGGLAAGFTLGFLVIRGRAHPHRAAGLAVALLLGASALVSARGDGGLAPSPLTVAPSEPSPPLPALAVTGALVGQRCVPSGASAIRCATDGLELLALSGPAADLAEADPQLAAAMPSPGRCARYTTAAEQVLVVRPTSGDATVLAILPQAWPRYAALRESLSAGRCPGR